jgi:hypothetical protein
MDNWFLNPSKERKQRRGRVQEVHVAGKLGRLHRLLLSSRQAIELSRD